MKPEGMIAFDDNTEITPEPSLHDDINATIDSLSDDSDKPAITKPAIEAPAPVAGATPTAKVGQTPAAEGIAAKNPDGTPIVEVKPPQSWKPEMRERWKSLPPEVQNEVLRREREISVGLQSAADSRKFQEAFHKVAAPYSQYLAAHADGNPLNAFDNYLKTATLLRTGSPQEKAQAVAMAIGEYGVEINLLDSALAMVVRGQRFSQTQPNQQQQQFRDPRLDAFLSEREQESQEAMSSEYQAFASDPKNEFFGDVRNDIADLLEFEASKGRKMSLQQAYDRCCRVNDSIQATLESRKTQNRQLEGARKVAAARHAGSSIGVGKAAPAPAMSSKGTGTVRDDIAAAIDSLTNA